MPTSRERISTACLDFVSTGGYALQSYDRFRRIVQDKRGLLEGSQPRHRSAASYERRSHSRNSNVESIRVVSGRASKRSAKTMDRRAARSARWRKAFSNSSRPATPSCSARQVWRFETIVGMDCLVTPAPGAEARLNPELGRLEVRPLHLSRRPRSPDDRRPGRLAAACRTTCRNGCRSRTSARKSPPRTRCWWRPSSAANATSLSPILSTGGSATAPSATSSPAGWSAPNASPSASSPTITPWRSGA